MAQAVALGMKKLLITGAGGFIGTHFLNSPFCSQFEVVPVVRDGKTLLSEGVVPVVVDIGKKGWTSCLPKDVDTVLHLAQSRLYREFPEGATDMVAVNVMSTFELLEWARIVGVKRFVFTSTGNVNDAFFDNQGNKIDCIPAGMYGATKLCAEALALQYQQILSVAVCRLFSVYGPEQRNALVPNILKRILDGVAIDLAEGKGLVLSPIHVMDVCEALAVLAQDNSRSGVIHISGPEVLSLLDMAESMGDALGIQPNLQKREGKARRLTHDPKDTVELLGRPLRIFSNEIADVAAELAN